MGKKLIIKNADFSEDAVNTFDSFTALYAYMGENDELIEVPIDQVISGKGAFISVDRNANIYKISHSGTYMVSALIENKEEYTSFSLKTHTGLRQNAATIGVLVFRGEDEKIIKAYCVLPRNVEETDIYKATTPESDVILIGNIPEGTVDIRCGFVGGSEFELLLEKYNN